MSTKGVNKAIIVGNLGNDPEVRYTPSGAAITKISIATSESWKDKNTGQMQEKTEWHNVTFFGKLAEIAGEYLRKGSQVYIEGKLKTDKYTDKQGVEKYSTGIVVDSFSGVMQMLGGKNEGGSQKTASNQQQQQHQNNQQGYQNQQNPNYQQQQAPQQQQGQNNNFDDDIPF